MCERGGMLQKSSITIIFKEKEDGCTIYMGFYKCLDSIEAVNINRNIDISHFII